MVIYANKQVYNATIRHVHASNIKSQIRMHMNHRIITILFCAILLSSCSLIRFQPLELEYQKEWTGKSYSEIVREFGAPDRVEYDGLDGSILIYEEYESTTSTDVDTHFGRFDPDYTTTVTTDKKYTQFFIDSSNTCYLVKSNKTQIDQKSLKNAQITLGVTGGVFGFLLCVLPFFI